MKNFILSGIFLLSMTSVAYSQTEQEYIGSLKEDGLSDKEIDQRVEGRFYSGSETCQINDQETEVECRGKTYVLSGKTINSLSRDTSKNKDANSSSKKKNGAVRGSKK